MKNFQVKLSKFEINSIIVFVLSLIASALGYGYQIVLANLLTVEAYGMANTFVTMIAILSTFISPICIITSRKTALYAETHSYIELDNFLANIIKITTILCVILGIVLFTLSFIPFFQIQNNFFILLLFLIIATTAIYSVLLYIIQGYKNFILFGMIGIVILLAKMCISIVLLKLGFELYGVLIAILLANIICITIMLVPTNKYKLVKRYNWGRVENLYKEIIMFYGWSFFLQLFVSFVCSGGDLIIIRTIYLDYNTGLYSVAITLAKGALFGITPITAVMFPEVAKNSNTPKIAIKYLYRTLIYSSIIAANYLILLCLFGKTIIGLLYGAKYLEAVAFLYPTAFYIFSVILLNIIFQYFLALGELKKITIIVGSAVAAMFLLVKFKLPIIECIYGFGTIISCTVICAIFLLFNQIKGGNEGEL